jgi:hypothetical protein
MARDDDPPPTAPKSKQSQPFTKSHHDPYDAVTDPYSTGLHPEPLRNGLGASIRGPRNRDRERQAPDLIRPPSTDSGHIPNMRWSFADSHMKIEVKRTLSFCGGSITMLCGWLS